MKLKHIFSAIAGLILTAGITSCGEDEKDIVIIDGNLPIKATTLYMVGDATSGGWSLDAATSFTPTEEDPLLFTWEGGLNAGEMKLCLVLNSDWSMPFIRPEANGEEINKTPIANKAFVMWAGDPDNKWKVSEAGIYKLTFDLRNWTMSTEYLGEKPEEPSEPSDPLQETDVLYILGDATPTPGGGWDNNNPFELTKTSDHIFEFEGTLKKGEMKACIEKGSWDVPFVRPTFDKCKITKEGVEDPNFVFTTSPDDKWLVEDAGKYKLTFDLENQTLKAEFLGEEEPGDNPGAGEPIETNTLYMIGDATPNGWSMDNASEFTQDTDNKYIFTWTGNLGTGNMKACLVKDGTFSCPFLRPSTANVEISSAGVAASDFVFTTGPDDQWSVTEAGTYKITFDLEHRTITAEKL